MWRRRRGRLCAAAVLDTLAAVVCATAIAISTAVVSTRASCREHEDAQRHECDAEDLSATMCRTCGHATFPSRDSHCSATPPSHRVPPGREPIAIAGDTPRAEHVSGSSSSGRARVARTSPWTTDEKLAGIARHRAVLSGWARTSHARLQQPGQLCRRHARSAASGHAAATLAAAGLEARGRDGPRLPMRGSRRGQAASGES